MSKTIRFEIPHNPLPKQRARVVGKSAYTPSRTRDYERLVAWYAQIATGGQLLDGDLLVTLHFYRKGKKRADIDNLIKAIFDGCNGVVWTDDKQVIAVNSMIQYESKQPCTVVEVKKIA